MSFLFQLYCGSSLTRIQLLSDWDRVAARDYDVSRTYLAFFPPSRVGYLTFTFSQIICGCHENARSPPTRSSTKKSWSTNGRFPSVSPRTKRTRNSKVHSTTGRSVLATPVSPPSCLTARTEPRNCFTASHSTSASGTTTTTARKKRSARTRTTSHDTRSPASRADRQCLFLGRRYHHPPFPATRAPTNPSSR